MSTPAELRKLFDDGRLQRGILGGLSVPGPLQRLLPGGLSRQRAAAITGGIGSTSLAMMLMASATDYGRWAAVVGVPGWGWVAAEAAGVCIDRTVAVPDPGQHWAAAIAALSEGMALIVARPPGPIPAKLRTRLQARLRRDDCALLILGDWPEAAVRLSTAEPRWHGIRPDGRGRLQRRTLTVTATDRTGRTQSSTLWLPDGRGRVRELAPTRTVEQWFSGTWGKWNRVRLELADAGVDGWATIQDGPGETYQVSYHAHRYLAEQQLSSIIEAYPHLPWRHLTDPPRPAQSPAGRTPPLAAAP